METQKVQHEKAGALWKTLTECMSWFIKDLKEDFENFFIYCVCNMPQHRCGERTAHGSRFPYVRSSVLAANAEILF